MKTLMEEFGSVFSEQLPTSQRPKTQVYARQIMAATPNPWNVVTDGRTTYPMPGKGQNGESST